MANTYTLIASNTVGSGGAASVTFSSIAATYTDLLLKTSARNSTANTEDWIYATINSDTGANYTNLLLRGNGTTAASGTATTSYLIVGQAEGSGSTASTFTNSECYIPNYAGANKKSANTDSVTENNATYNYMFIMANLWNSTSAITSIQLVSANGNFSQYSTFYLYGIKNS